MDKKKYASSIINANYKSNVWMIFSFILLLGDLLLAGYIFKTDTSEKTIVTPPRTTKPFTIKGNKVSPQYIEEMGRYFSQLLLTYHKKNAKSQFNDVLYYVDPSIYSEMETKFSLDVDRISRNDISSVFYLMKIHIKENVAIIEGQLKGFIGSQMINDNLKTYEMKFQYNGKLMITGWNELKKDSTGKYEKVKQDYDFGGN